MASLPGARPPMSWARVFGAICASAIGLGFWWALTEPLPVPPAILLGVAGAILFCAGLIAGRGGALAAPVALLFSLFFGSILATQLHQAFRPQSLPIEEFNASSRCASPSYSAPSRSPSRSARWRAGWASASCQRGAEGLANER